MSLNHSDIFSKVNTNRLLCDTESLNSKVNYYRQCMSLGLSSSTSHRTGETFNPKCNINTLKSLSNTFTSISKKPELLQLPANVNNSDNFYLFNLKQSYEKHINDLYSNFKQCLTKLEELNSNYSKTKIDAQLIKSVINDSLFYERENQIANFIEEISELKAQQNDINNISINMQNMQKSYELELQKTKEENEKKMLNLKQENEVQKENLLECQEELNYMKNDNEETKNEMDRLQKIISVLEIDLNKSEEKINEKSKKYEELQVEYANLQAQFFDASLKCKKYIEENTSLKNMVEHYEKERKEFIDKCSSFNSEDSYKDRFDYFDSQIKELKFQKDNLEKDLNAEREKSQLNQKKFNNTVVEMEEKVKFLSTEWEKKLTNERSDYEKIITEIEAKHKSQLDSIFIEHQSELDSKNTEIEKLKKSDELLKNFEREYIKIIDHEKKINEITEKYKSKYEKEFESKKSNYELDLQMKLNKMESDKKMEYDFLTGNIKTNLQRAEKENFDIKNRLMQIENQLHLSEAKNDNLNKENVKISNDVKSKVLEIEQLKSDLRICESKFASVENAKKMMIEQIKTLQESNISEKELEKKLSNEKVTCTNLRNEVINYQKANHELEEKIKFICNINEELKYQLQNVYRCKKKLIEMVLQFKSELAKIKNEYNMNITQFKTNNKQMLDSIFIKINAFDLYRQNKMKGIEKKLKEEINAQILENEKIKQINISLSENIKSNKIQINNLTFKVSELENEIQNYKSTLSKQKKEIIAKKEENENLSEKSSQSYKKVKNAITETLLNLSKIKKKYQNEIFSLKTKINNLKQLYIGDIMYFKSVNKEDVLQRKINLLETEKGNWQEMIQKLKIKLSGILLEKQNKEAEYEKIIAQKDKRIKDLQCIVNQSFYSYSTGVNSIKVAKKLDGDVKELIQKAKVPESVITTINSDE